MITPYDHPDDWSDEPVEPYDVEATRKAIRELNGALRRSRRAALESTDNRAAYPWDAPHVAECPCGRRYWEWHWPRLDFVGFQEIPGEEPLDLRNCISCHSTIAKLRSEAAEERTSR